MAIALAYTAALQMLRATGKAAVIHPTGKHNATWDLAYAEACKYRQERGDLNVLSSYVTKNGIRLGRWLSEQKARLNGKPPADQKQQTP